MALEVGDVIRQKSGQPFRSGCCADPEAIVISLDPLAWVSEGGAMLWRTNLDPDSVEVVRKATPEELKAANRRLVDVQRGERKRQIRKLIETLTTDSLPEVAYDVLFSMLTSMQAQRLNELTDATDGDFYIKERSIEWCRKEHQREPWDYVLGSDDEKAPIEEEPEVVDELNAGQLHHTIALLQEAAQLIDAYKAHPEFVQTLKEKAIELDKLYQQMKALEE